MANYKHKDDTNENIFISNTLRYKTNTQRSVLGNEPIDFNNNDDKYISITQPDDYPNSKIIVQEIDEKGKVLLSNEDLPSDAKYTTIEDRIVDTSSILSPIQHGVSIKPLDLSGESSNLRNEFYSITILQQPHQTIYAYEVDKNGNYTGTVHNESFFAKKGSIWRYAVVPDREQDTKYWINILQSDNQLITVRTDVSNRHVWRAGVLVAYPDDDKLKDMYPEMLSDPSNRYEYIIVNQNCRIFATLAYDIYNDKDFHIVRIIRNPHEYIYVKINDIIYSDSEFMVEDGVTASITVVTNDGYIPATITINGVDQKTTTKTITINSETTISATMAIPIGDEFTLTPGLFISDNSAYNMHIGEINFAQTDDSSFMDKIHKYGYTDANNIDTEITEDSLYGENPDNTSSVLSGVQYVNSGIEESFDEMIGLVGLVVYKKYHKYGYTLNNIDTEITEDSFYGENPDNTTSTLSGVRYETSGIEESFDEIVDSVVYNNSFTLTPKILYTYNKKNIPLVYTNRLYQDGYKENYIESQLSQNDRTKQLYYGTDGNYDSPYLMKMNNSVSKIAGSSYTIGYDYSLKDSNIKKLHPESGTTDDRIFVNIRNNDYTTTGKYANLRNITYGFTDRTKANYKGYWCIGLYKNNINGEPYTDNLDLTKMNLIFLDDKKKELANIKGFQYYSYYITNTDTWKNATVYLYIKYTQKADMDDMYIYLNRNIGKPITILLNLYNK